jgi:predicted helicase
MSADLITGSQSWSDFEQGLAALGADRKAEKGRAFEELTRLHLLSDPVFATKLTEVWHHTDVPQKIADELGLQRPEIGVDLIARTRRGDYWAIQCKYHQDRSRNVTYDELKTFLSITERHQTYERLSHRLVCTSARASPPKASR